MTKHKKFHSLRGKGKAAHMYAVIHRRNQYDSAFRPEQLKKKAATGLTKKEVTHEPTDK